MRRFYPRVYFPYDTFTLVCEECGVPRETYSKKPRRTYCSLNCLNLSDAMNDDNSILQALDALVESFREKYP